MSGFPPRDATADSGSYRISAEPEIARLEQQRLRALGRFRDPFSIAILERLAVAQGWRCLEVGGGAGSLARWLAERVGDSGHVLSTDLDLRFHGEPQRNLEIRQHDITCDPLPEAHFDLVHARALLQHVPERERALDRMVAALRPGGWLLVEDSDFTVFEAQPRPPAFAAVSDAMTRTTLELRPRWDRHVGRQLLAWFRARGLSPVEVEGRVTAMRGGSDSAEWYLLAMQYAGRNLVRAGAVSEETLAQALREGRDPGFAILSPLSIACWGRKPG